MDQHTRHPPNRKAKPSPSYTNLQANPLSATLQTTKLPSGVGRKTRDCLGLLECMYANLQLQSQLAQQQKTILGNLQASISQLAPGRESKNSSIPALFQTLLMNHLLHFHK